MNIFRNSRGFNMVGLTVTIAGASAFALGFASMINNQGKAVKGLIVKIEVQNIHNTISELMRNEANCTATMMAASPTPPSMLEPIEMDAIYSRRLVNGVMQSVPFYVTNRLYDNSVKITQMLIRPNIPTDETPGAKLVIKYQINGKIVGASNFTKKLELFTSTSAMAEFPGYAFRCGVSGASTSLGTNNATDNTLFIPNGGSCPDGVVRTGSITCPPNQYPVSCGMQDTDASDDEDVPGCWANPAIRGCSYTVDKSSGCDSFTMHCLCL